MSSWGAWGGVLVETSEAQVVGMLRRRTTSLQELEESRAMFQFELAGRKG